MYKETDRRFPNENDSHLENNAIIFDLALEISRNAHIYIIGVSNFANPNV